MKSKVTKTVGVILTILLVLWVGVFTVDYHRSSSLEKPIFAIAGETADDGGSVEYSDLGYTEVEEYSSIRITNNLSQNLSLL